MVDARVSVHVVTWHENLLTGGVSVLMKTCFWPPSMPRPTDLADAANCGCEPMIISFTGPYTVSSGQWLTEIQIMSIMS
jgi:hypothetical protein